MIAAADSPVGSFRLPPGPGRFRAGDWLAWVARPLSLLSRYRARYGPSFTLHGFPGRPTMVWLGEPEAIRDLFAADPDVVHAGEANFIVEGVLGSRSLLMLDGEPHRRMRRLMSPPFHGERVRAYGEAMAGITAAAVARWPVGQTISLLDEMQAITLDVIMRTVFGIEDAARQDRLRALLRQLLSWTASPVLFGASMMLGPARLRRMIAAGAAPRQVGPFRIDPSPLVPGSGLHHAMQEVDALLLSEFRLRRQRGGDGSDVLSLLLSARDEQGRPMDDVELRDEMMTLLVAGHETTATSLAWAFHHLLARPEALARLSRELGAGGASGRQQVEATLSCDYLDAVVRETLRLTPVVPLVARLLQRDLTVGPYRLPAGTMVMPSIYLTHHRADLYPEPERFLPERFLEWRPAAHEYLPFGGGARRCLGATFATFEMKLVLAEVLRAVDLEPVGPAVHLERRAILFAPSGGTQVRVRPRPRA